MGIGLGVVLVVAGLIFVLDVINVRIGVVDEVPLGWILIAAGALTIILSLVMNAQRSRTRHTVEERRYDAR